MLIVNKFYKRIAQLDIESLLSKLNENFNMIDRMAVQTGDCGTFAFALSKVLSEIGISVDIAIGLFDPEGVAKNEFSLNELDHSELDFIHIGVFVNNKLYDIAGAHDINNEYQNEHWAGYPIRKWGIYPPSDKLITTIRNNTGFMDDWPYYYHLIKEILSEKSKN